MENLISDLGLGNLAVTDYMGGNRITYGLCILLGKNTAVSVLETLSSSRESESQFKRIKDVSHPFSFVQQKIRILNSVFNPSHFLLPLER